jgi:hypothetical protein
MQALPLKAERKIARALQLGRDDLTETFGGGGSGRSADRKNEQQKRTRIFHDALLNHAPLICESADAR